MFSCQPSNEEGGEQEPSAAEETPAETTQETGMKTWKLQEYGQPGDFTQVPEQIDVTLMMDLKENRISGKAGCNRYNAQLETEEEGISIGNPVSTKMMCSDEAMKMESEYLAMLQQVTGYEIQSGRMIMTLDDGRQLVFTS